jgi:hypothetical protein
MASDAPWTFTPTKLFFNGCGKTFNSMLKGVIFQELHATNGDIIQFIPFVHTFYAFESPLFYNHHNREFDVIIIASTMGTCQGVLGGDIICFSQF